MKITKKLAKVTTPDGGDMELFQHEMNFYIKINGQILMDSRAHESEFELARLGCVNLNQDENTKILIGGLGLGYTARQCLDMVGPKAEVIVCELMEAVIDWNHNFVGVLADYPLNDQRASTHQGDIVEFLSNTQEEFDAILLDVDNGPEAMTDSGNSRLYDCDGIFMCMDALKANGRLAVWSTDSSKYYEKDLINAGFSVRRYLSPSTNHKQACKHVIYVASQMKEMLPRGGTEIKTIKYRKKRKNKRNYGSKNHKYSE
ncbi:hypothetical protein KAJ27_21725 [bacterium]|nr:hypothetical protein [bacterium]